MNHLWRRAISMCALLGSTLLSPLLCFGVEDQVQKAKPDDTPSDSVVLLIGVADYGLWGELKGPSHDTCALRGMYKSLLGVPDGNIIVHLGVAQDVPAPCTVHEARRVTRKALQASIEELAARRPAPRIVYVHFSGHGVEERGAHRLILSGEEAGKSAAESIGLDELLASLHARLDPITRVAAFIDACRDTSTPGESGPPSGMQPPGGIETARRLLPGRDGAVFFAASPGQYSHTRRSIQGARTNQVMGYFTWAVIRGMVGGARDESARITFGSLARYLEQEVAASRRYDFGGAGEDPQQPQSSMLSVGSPDVRLGAADGAPLNRSFQFYAEASVAARGEDGTTLAGPFSFDLMAPQLSRPPTELNLIGATIVHPPGPWTLPLPRGMDVPSNVHHWTFAVRAVFFYGPNRREFVVCRASPRLPEGTLGPGARPELVASVDGQQLVIDVTGAWRLIGHHLRELDEVYDPSVKATHLRSVAQGC